MKFKELPEQKYLQECFTYNFHSGTLVWKERPQEHFKTPAIKNIFNGRMSNQSAGTTFKNGYRYVKLDGETYRATRLIWKLVTGNDPKELIDHIDGNPTNDAFKNLREATFSQNACNSINSRLWKGVSKSGEKFRARITVDKKRISLGSYDLVHEAYNAYCEAAVKYHGEFANFGRFHG